ncbi:MAG: hypothetical protein HFF86_10365 [Oscillibacter sp.]|nr:hypothetical protein [Oscillibacter sp.]
MEKYDIASLLKALNVKQDIFICGPSYSKKTTLRVYAYCGILCGLPTNPQGKISLPDEQYLPSNSPLRAVFNGLQSNEEREEFLQKHLDELLLFMEKRSFAVSGDCDERSQQTTISRGHTDFQRHNGTVVCDFQSSIPTAWLPAGMSRPAFDMVTFSMDETGHGFFTLVELKCNESSCTGDRGLEKHAKDMLACVQSPSTSHFYKKELLRRLGYMCEYGLLQNCPTGLEHLRPEELNLQAAFLFTSGKGLESCEKAAALCKEYIPEEDLDKFRYCFAGSPQAVDLSHMESWNTFSSHQ